MFNNEGMKDNDLTESNINNNDKIDKLNSNKNIILNKNELNVLYEELEKEIETKYKNKYIDPNDTTNIEIMRFKAINEYYPSSESFLEDLNTMFKNIYNNECSDESTHVKKIKNVNKRYLTKLYLESLKIVKEKSNCLKALFDQDILSIINNNKLPRRAENSNYKNIPVNKVYETIYQYQHIHPDKTIPKTLTTFTPKCDGDCCLEFEDLGPLSLEKGNWTSKCKDRHNNMECDPNVCGCKGNCKNQSITNNNMKKLGIDVEERYAWGIDLFTFRNLIDFLPANIDESHKANFISLHLLKSFSLLQREGWNIRKACKYIYENIDTYYLSVTDSKTNILLDKNNVYNLSKHLYRLLTTSNSARKNTTAYSKGMGIFCMKKDGIKQSELINTYLGEIYPPWYWFEKQDLIKKHKLDKELPDFYNIMLERLKTDESGYDVIFIDPNSKGNFASRMSHSCEPNCNTVLMVTQKQYTIGMFATKNINYQDELCFDYSSVTEKEKEFLEAICLCGSYNCRGHYLIFANSLQLTDTLNDYHNFLNRNSILLQACEDPVLNEKDIQRLNDFSVKSSILGKAPCWLQKWASLILKFIEFELKLLPEYFAKLENSPTIPLKKISKKQTTDDLINTNKCKEKDKVNNSSYLAENERVNLIDIPYKNGNGSYSNPKNIDSETQSNSNLYNNNGDCNINGSYYKKVELILNNKCVNGGVILTTSASSQIHRHNQQNVLHENGNCKSKDLNCLNFKSDNQSQNSSSQLNHSENEIENENENNLSETKEKEVDKPNTDKFKYDIMGIKENRIQNLAITINKVIHVLELMNIDKPPLIRLSEQEIFENLWSNENTNSIKNVLLRNFKGYLHLKIERSDLIIIKIKEIINIITNKDIEEVKISNLVTNDESSEVIDIYSHKNNMFRSKLRKIAIILTSCADIDKSKLYICYKQLSDILVLYSKTFIYFKHNDNYNKSTNSEVIEILKRDINIFTGFKSVEGQGKYIFYIYSYSFINLT